MVEKKSRPKALEDRLRKLETIVNSLHLDEHSQSGESHEENRWLQATVIPTSPALSTAPFPAFVDQLRLDLEDVFFSTNSGYLFVSEKDVRRAMKESVFLRFVIYAMSASVAPPNLVTADFGTKQVMAEAYFRRAESFLRRVFRKPSYHGVLGLMGLVVFCTRTNRGSEAFYFYTVGVRIALSIGLNSEDEYQRQRLSDEQKEIMRCTWWSVYLGDRLLSALRFEPPLIKDEDCLVTLPCIPGQICHPQDQMDSLQAAIMSSKEWYVPTPRNLSIGAYLLILVKIHGRIIAFSQESKNPRNRLSKADYLYRESAIASALRDWYASIPEHVRNVAQEINSDTPPVNPDITWKNAFIMTLYNCIRIYLPKRTLFYNIKENVTLAATSSAARDIFLAGCDVSIILQGFMKHNPQFLFVPPFIASCVFGAGLMLLVISRLHLNPNDVKLAQLNVQACLTCLNQHAVLYDIGTSQKALLEKLHTCQDPVLLVLAISNLKNMKGDVIPSIQNSMLQFDTEDEPLDSLDQVQQMNSLSFQSMNTNVYTDSALLESVAHMSNPYAELMMGVTDDVSFDQMFHFQDN